MPIERVDRGPQVCPAPQVEIVLALQHGGDDKCEKTSAKGCVLQLPYRSAWRLDGRLGLRGVGQVPEHDGRVLGGGGQAVLVVSRPVERVDAGKMSCDRLDWGGALSDVPQLHLAVVGGGKQLARHLVPLDLGGALNCLQLCFRPSQVPGVPQVDVVVR